jgi:two-component system, LytTR family, sensor histidine kinase AlgZ
VHCFLQVEKVRFGARLDMHEEIDPAALNCLVPPLLLQPLVENAIAHGIAHLPEGGRVRLVVQRAGDDVSILVENRFDPEVPPSRRNGLGLENVRQRLTACYDERARMDVTRGRENFRVNLVLPAEGPVKKPEEKGNGAA